MIKLKIPKTLTSLEIGETATIKEVCAKGSIKRRLLDIGFTPGALAECVLKSPASDPIAYKIRGSIIALRNEDSDTVIIN